ncbi:MAG: TPM domain-containing protein [Planctomycetes bacterium]|nr:TPM domain-containing protein [Planctomycetota bacterium]
MAKASANLSDGDRRRVEEAVREAESRTAAEIVPVVTAASSRYHRAEDIMALWCGLIAYVLLGVFSPEHLIDFWEGLIVLGLAVALGALLSNRVPALKRALAGKTEMAAQAMDMAFRHFRTFGVGDTAGRTGVLIFVSLFERQAVVIGDRALADKLKPEDYGSIRDALLEKLKAGELAAGLEAAVRRAGEVLAPICPRAPGDVDEIPNALRVLE